MEEKILKHIYESLENGEKAAMVIITEENGSTPRKNGSIMAVWSDGRIAGSIGGGIVEHEVIARAINCMEKGTGSSFEYNLSSSGEIGMQCGGSIKGFIKLFIPKPKLLIVGGGHIGEQVYRLGKFLNFHIVIFDDRDEFANKKRFSEAEEIFSGRIEDNISNYPIDKNSYIVIAAKGHKQDGDALKAVISRGAAYIGMIGSSTKVIHIMKKLMEEGVPREELQKVYAPIGLDTASELPEEIAFGILSEILQVKNQGSLKHMKDIKNSWTNL